MRKQTLVRNDSTYIILCINSNTILLLSLDENKKRYQAAPQPLSPLSLYTCIYTTLVDVNCNGLQPWRSLLWLYSPNASSQLCNSFEDRVPVDEIYDCRMSSMQCPDKHVRVVLSAITVGSIVLYPQRISLFWTKTCFSLNSQRSLCVARRSVLIVHVLMPYWSWKVGYSSGPFY